MRQNLQAILFLTPILAIGLLYTIFQSVDPVAVGPGGILAVFILIYVACLSSLFILLKIGLIWSEKLFGSKKNRKLSLLSVNGSRKVYYAASILAFIPVTFLAMNAYSRLNFIDIALVFVLTVVAIFYIIKRN